MNRRRRDIIRMRETEAGGCRACGRNLSQSETGFAIELVVEAVFLDPGLLEPLLIRRCPGCGTRYDWDVLVAGDELESDWPRQEAIQAELLETLREMLQTPLLQPADAARRIRGSLGVEAVYVAGGSEVAQSLRRLLDRPG
jgi:hypothetical protein